jgi:hypothetical protein
MFLLEQIFGKRRSRPDTSLTMQTDHIVDTHREPGDIADTPEEQRRPGTWLTLPCETDSHVLEGHVRRA